MVCLVVGDTTPFVVEIPLHKPAGLLKPLIKKELALPETFSAKELKLYVAKKDDGKWIKTTDSVMQELESGKLPDAIGAPMDPTLRLNSSAIGFPDESEDGDIHVLVKVPKTVVGDADLWMEQPTPKKKQKVEQAPDLWMKALKEERVAILPTDLEGLRTHLERPLREKIPIIESSINFAAGFRSILSQIAALDCASKEKM